MRIVPFISFLALFFLTGTTGIAQAVADQPHYLDEVLAATTKKSARYYRVNEGKEGDLFIGKIYTIEGKLKAEGRYLDAGLNMPNGAFVFYHPNGKVESKGMYVNGNKSGIWERFDVWGQPLAEKIYDPEPLANIIYTRAQTMPEFPNGGERAFVKYLREKVTPISGQQLKGIITASFVVEKNGELSDVKVIGGKDQVFDGQLVDAVKSTSPWQPGADAGRPVRVQMRVPVQF